MYLNNACIPLKPVAHRIAAARVNKFIWWCNLSPMEIAVVQSCQANIYKI